MKSKNLFFYILLTAVISSLVTTLLANPTAVSALRGERAPAAPPAPVISYQGRITVNGQPYNGVGYFKFAIMVDETSWIWRTSDPITLPVTNGLFDVLLGDANITNMPPISNTVFSSPYRWLRVFFSSDGITFNQLSPDRRLAWAPYAFEAYNASTLDGIDSVQFAIKDSTLQTNLNADLLDGVHVSSLQLPGGAMVLGLPNDASLLSAGFLSRGRTNVMSWMVNTGVNSPSYGRKLHTAIWTGSEMIIWGGTQDDFFAFSDGGRYDPAADTWTTLPTSGALSGRWGHTAVWTGTEMIIWGGRNGTTYFTDGARYNPATNTWSTLADLFGENRSGHTAVWTGTEMLIWGGYNGEDRLDTGFHYNPATNSWASITTASAPAARERHTAVWTGTKMIVWGGYGASSTFPYYLNSGGCYTPGAGWTATDTTAAPAARGYHTAIWTSNGMIIWGGANGASSMNDGMIYNPSINSWASIPISGAPAARYQHTAVWTGSEMVIWGGANEAGKWFGDGAAYNTTLNVWSQLSIYETPQLTYQHTAIWDGSQMVVFGGSGGVSNRLLMLLYLYRKP